MDDFLKEYEKTLKEIASVGGIPKKYFDDEYISQQEPVNPTFCAGCSEELHAPFLVISPHRTYYDPPCEEWYCRKCSASNKAWSGRRNTRAACSRVYLPSCRLSPLAGWCSPPPKK